MPVADLARQLQAAAGPELFARQCEAIEEALARWCLFVDAFPLPVESLRRMSLAAATFSARVQAAHVKARS